MTPVTDIVNNPHWFLHGIDLDQASLRFVKTDQQTLADASFLDQRFNIQGLPSVTLSLNEALSQLDTIPSTPPRFVFHTAFCCSTLLARCLNLASANTSLKEPEVLMALANYQRTQHPRLANSADSALIYKLVTRLLFRPFAEGQTVVVKPTNTVNNIIQPLLLSHIESKALFLHSDLTSFLLSTLKKGEQGRGFARHLFTMLRMDSVEAQQLDMIKLLRMTDSQVTALAWHLQWEQLVESISQFDAGRIRSVHCDRLLDAPRETLSKLIDFFDCPALQQQFEELIEQAPLSADAKQPGQRFAASDRTQEYAQAEQQFQDSLNVIIPWAKQLQFKHPYSDHLAQAL